MTLKLERFLFPEMNFIPNVCGSQLSYRLKSFALTAVYTRTGDLVYYLLEQFRTFVCHKEVNLSHENEFIPPSCCSSIWDVKCFYHEV